MQTLLPGFNFELPDFYLEVCFYSQQDLKKCFIPSASEIDGSHLGTAKALECLLKYFVYLE